MSQVSLKIRNYGHACERHIKTSSSAGACTSMYSYTFNTLKWDPAFHFLTQASGGLVVELTPNMLQVQKLITWIILLWWPQIGSRRKIRKVYFIVWLSIKALETRLAKGQNKFETEQSFWGSGNSACTCWKDNRKISWMTELLQVDGILNSVLVFWVKHLLFLFNAHVVLLARGA